jgi:Plasmid encoded RepA protein
MNHGRELQRAGQGGQSAETSTGFRPISAILPQTLKDLSAPKARLLSFASAEACEGILYQHSVLCQMSMPYRNPGESERRWRCKNGYLTLELDAGRAFDERIGDFIDVGLPYGPKPRLVLYHLNAEAVRTHSPVIELERSLSAFVKRTLGLAQHGRNLQTIREQLIRLAAADFRIGKASGGHSITVQGRILNGMQLWTPPTRNERRLWPTQVQFSAEYFESLLNSAVPLNESAVAHLSHNAMALDIYVWLAQRLHRIESGKDALVSWGALQEQFGAGYAQVREFRRVFKHTLAQVRVVYPDARFELSALGMSLNHSRPPVAKRLLPLNGPIR